MSLVLGKSLTQLIINKNKNLLFVNSITITKIISNQLNNHKSITKLSKKLIETNLHIFIANRYPNNIKMPEKLALLKLRKTVLIC